MKYSIIDRSQPFRFIFLYFHNSRCEMWFKTIFPRSSSPPSLPPPSALATIQKWFSCNDQCVLLYQQQPLFCSYLPSVRSSFVFAAFAPSPTTRAVTAIERKRQSENDRKKYRYEFIWSFVCYTRIKYMLFTLVYIGSCCLCVFQASVRLCVYGKSYAIDRKLCKRRRQQQQQK